MSGSPDAPSYDFELNGVQASDYFTKLTTDRYVRQQLGTFSIVLDDWQFNQWSGLAKYQPAIFSIDGTRIFKGRIDTAVRHYDKSKGSTADQGGYLTTVSGRDDGGALQDIIVSRSYYLETPLQIFTDLITNVYPSRKGSLDPTLTLGTVDFHDTSSTYTYNWDRLSLWKCIEQLCEDVEGNQLLKYLFLDFWVDEEDNVNVTQTGELVSADVDLGDYGGEFIKTRDWTLDSLPVKNDIWFYGASSAGVVPLEIDPLWAQIHKVPQASPWTDGVADLYQWYGTSDITIANDPTTYFYPSKSAIEITVNPGGNLTSFGSGLGFGWRMPMPWGSQSNSDFKIFGRGPLGHLNWMNCDLMDESAGSIARVQFWLRSTTTIQMFLILLDGQSPPAAMISDTITYSPTQEPYYYAVMNFSLSPMWKPMVFTLMPGYGTLAPTALPNGFFSPPPAFFNWADVTQITFCAIPTQVEIAGAYTIPPLWFDDLCLLKPLVARNTNPPTDAVKSDVITDINVTSYQVAALRANQAQAVSSEAWSYVDYNVFGRPDIQAGYAFTSEGELMLVRESHTAVVKDAGYGVACRAWRAV